jgi:hypothetical protein
MAIFQEPLRSPLTMKALSEEIIVIIKLLCAVALALNVAAADYASAQELEKVHTLTGSRASERR